MQRCWKQDSRWVRLQTLQRRIQTQCGCPHWLRVMMKWSEGVTGVGMWLNMEANQLSVSVFEERISVLASCLWPADAPLYVSQRGVQVEAASAAQSGGGWILPPAEARSAMTSNNRLKRRSWKSHHTDPCAAATLQLIIHVIQRLRSLMPGNVAGCSSMSKQSVCAEE